MAKMIPTRIYRITIQARVRRDPSFRRALLREGIQCLLSGDLDMGKTVLRDYINATVGFAELGDAISKSPKSLMRMLGPSGNPQARNLLDVVAYLQRKEGTPFEVRATRR